MGENKIGEFVRASVDSAKALAQSNGFVGEIIHTPSGVTVIPVSKIQIGFAGGGVDYGEKKRFGADKNFGGGSGTGVVISPIAFLTVGATGDIRLVSVSEPTGAQAIDHAVSLIEASPDIIRRIKSALFE